MPGTARPGAGRRGRSRSAHFAERFQLFIIIALGESIVITGATTSDLELDAPRLAAFALAFLGTAALWWLYFNYAPRMAERRLALAEDRTALARDGYTYLHVLMVAGIIVSAVGDELVIAHPTEHLHGDEVAAVVAGPAIYLLAQALFRLRMAGSVSWKRLGGAAGCLAVGLVGTSVSGARAVGARRRRARRRDRRGAGERRAPLGPRRSGAARGARGLGGGRSRGVGLPTSCRSPPGRT